MLSYYNTGELKGYTCTYKQGSLETNSLYDELFHGSLNATDVLPFFLLFVFCTIRKMQQLVGVFMCVCGLSFVWKSKKVNYRR